jgi:germination protein M
MNTNIKNEERIIEAIVYTLTSIENVDFVIIYMEGEILTKLPQSKITLPSTLDRSIGINKEYNLTNKNNINKTTIYYISEFNDTMYYVPVTKVNNDNRNKIEIIIDELSSSNVYKSNLMSYLNNNTKILSVNENENEISVNFNTAIFNDINTKDILEEVIYTISMSINDNYNVENVIFNVENEEIYKSVLKSIE